MKDSTDRAIIKGVTYGLYALVGVCLAAFVALGVYVVNEFINR